MLRTAELREKAAAVHAQVEAILGKSREEKRGLNTEEQASFDKASGELTSLMSTIQAEEKLEQSRKFFDSTELRDQQQKREADKPEEIERRAWMKYLRAGAEVLDTQERAMLRPMRNDGREERALSIVTNTAGQYTVPTDWADTVVTAMKSYVGVLQAGPRLLTTAGGNPINYPTMNDTSNVGALIAENTAATDLDVAFGSVSIGAYKYTTRQIKIPTELLEDSAVDVEGLIRAAMAERIGRILNQHFTTGTGSGQPTGVVTASTLGKTTAAVGAVTSNEILDLIHSVDPAYRDGAKLMFHDTTLKAILQLLDSQNRPLFQVSPRDGAPATIHGRQFVINQDMATMATGNKFMLFGDFSYVIVRRARDLGIKRLVERYAEADQVAFVGFTRWDSNFIDASGGAMKHMKNA